jgi:hypothetical protein
MEKHLHIFGFTDNKEESGVAKRLAIWSWNTAQKKRITVHMLQVNRANSRK